MRPFVTRHFRWRIATIASPLLATALALVPGRACADLSLGAWIQHSPDDINTTNIPGLLTLSGNDATATATLPFSVVIGGTSYSTLVISTNGWIEFGSNTCVSGCGTANSDPVNAALPTSKHTNPFLAAYWDDLQSFGTNIRYGVVGTSPDRTYIIDYQVDVDPAVESGGNDDMRFQVQIHESSQAVSVHYDGDGNLANGQTASIGFQTAGGAAATAFPLTFNGKVLDDNRNNEGWSIDLHRTGAEALAAHMACSPDDIGIQTPAFTTLSGDNGIAGVTLPFSVTIEGISYNTVTIGTNGLVQFGTTTGANPAANGSLPSASFPNPTLFWFWDDLQTEGTAIRYGTVGTSPNRTFIIDFQENQVSSSGDKINGQLQIHEGSNLFNVKYRGTLSANSNGQTATIGFQGAGGASAAVYPLTLNGKILDDNRADEGWSVHAQATKDVSLHSLHEYSPDDIPGAGFTTLSGDNAIAGVTLPFSVVVDGVSYSTATIGTNGLVQFGTTTGNNPATNTALPSGSFSGPTLFWYWDDLQTFSSNIEYRTVGTSPNRTFVIDFQENRVGDTGNVVNGQVQIHEGSNAMNVQYRSTMSAGANGQSATIGFQGAGGASAKAYPLTFNGKILDDNLPDAGWSVSPLRYCGDGIVQSASPLNEQCDLGAANGTLGSCCTTSCTFASASTVCRPSAGGCDVPETCTGSSDTCPADDNPACTPTSTATSTSTSTATDTETPTNTATSTPIDTNTVTSTPTNTNTATSTPTNTPVDTPTSTPTLTHTSTETPTDTPTETPTGVPTVTTTPIDTPTDTPTSTPTDTAMDTPSSTPSATPTATCAASGSGCSDDSDCCSLNCLALVCVGATVTPSDTPTVTETPTDTPTVTPTETSTETVTDTPTMTPTETPTDTPAQVPTDTRTATPTVTAQTPTLMATPTGTPTATPGSAQCAATPVPGCRTALKSILLVKDNATNDAKDKLIWKWLKGQATTGVELGDPTATANYRLCIYTAASEGLVFEAAIPPSALLWKPIGSKGYKYKDGSGAQNGITKIVLKGSDSAKSKVLVKGKGAPLPDIPAATNPSLELDLPVRVQLVNGDNGICFEANYQSADVRKNTTGTFKGKAQ